MGRGMRSERAVVRPWRSSAAASWRCFSASCSSCACFVVVAVSGAGEGFEGSGADGGGGGGSSAGGIDSSLLLPSGILAGADMVRGTLILAAGSFGDTLSAAGDSSDRGGGVSAARTLSIGCVRAVIKSAEVIDSRVCCLTRLFSGASLSKAEVSTPAPMGGLGGRAMGFASASAGAAFSFRG